MSPATARLGGAPRTWREVRMFLAAEEELNDEWQARTTIRLFRVGQWLHRTQRRLPSRLLRKPWIVADRLWFQMFLNADVPPGVEIGLGVRFAHGARNLVFHPRVSIGSHCTIYHSVTIGLRGEDDLVPTIGNDVVLGTGAVVLGGVRIGDGSAIGPNAVIVRDVPARAHVVAPAPIVLPAQVVIGADRASATGKRIMRQDA